MKFELVLSLFVLSLIGCNKDEVKPIEPPVFNNYQSEGNFIIFVIGDSLEFAYEYNLSTIQLNNDSLPISYESVLDGSGMYYYHYWKFQPNTDTLFWSYSGSFEFIEEQVSSNDLLSLNNAVSFDLNQFQLIDSSPNTNIEYIWGNVSQLDIVKTYRESAPNSKIGLSKQIVYVYDPQLGFSIPQSKHLLFLVK
jgi:hypothetical protein